MDSEVSQLLYSNSNAETSSAKRETMSQSSGKIMKWFHMNHEDPSAPAPSLQIYKDHFEWVSASASE